MQASRLTAVEADNGDLLVTFRISQADKAEFFSRSPLPGDTVELFAFEPAGLIEHKPEKPPAQVVGADAFDSSEVMDGKALSEAAQFLQALTEYPPFQQYANERAPREVQDSVAESRLFIETMLEVRDLAEVRGNEKALRLLIDKFNAWFKAKYGPAAVIFQ